MLCSSVETLLGLHALMEGFLGPVSDICSRFQLTSGPVDFSMCIYAYI